MTVPAEASSLPESRTWRVGVARCEDYEPGRVGSALEAAVEAAGGWPESIRGDLLLKANLLAPRRPEEAVTTHPEVLRAAIRALRGLGRIDRCEVADNPGYIYRHQMGELFERTGVADLRREGVAVRSLSEEGLREVELAAGSALLRVRVSARYLNAGCVVDVAKLKTHVETEMTGCIKNLFGISDTDTRKTAHASPSLERLVEAVVDLYSVRPPGFCLLDAVVGMEGTGPSHGSPRPLGWILAAENALAVDWVAARIMGYGNPLDIPLLRAAARRGMGPRTQAEIDLRGAGWGDLPVPGFRRAPGLLRHIPTPLRGLAHRFVALRPRLDARACLRCGICAKVCPVEAIRLKPTPVISRGRCVACLCCHEMCPNGAMGVRANWIARLLSP